MNNHDAMIDAVSKVLIAKGLLIEAGFQSLRAAAIPASAPAIQIDEMRNAFFFGARHLYATIMRTLDPGEEPTEADMRRLDQINDELQRFITDYARRNIRTEGSA
jgi:hypothetical protein